MIQLFPFQKEYFTFVKPNYIYNCDTGTGKTYMALFHHQYFYPDKKVLLVAPASKVKEGGWQRVIAKTIPSLQYDIMSYNMLSKKYSAYKDYFVIFDECHRIKNSTGVWGKAAYKLTLQSAGFILLSATPLANGWQDSINYFKMFHLAKNKTQFLAMNAHVTNVRGYPEIIGWKNELKLENMWRSISHRLNKEDAVDLPPVIIKDVLFSSSKKYRMILKERYFDGVLYDNSMKLRHGLRLYSNLKDKIDYIKDFMDSTSDNIIVFYNYDLELELLKKTIHNKLVFFCNGYCKNYPKKEEWNNMRNSVTFVNYKSGSEAIELTYANILIYFGPCESYTEYSQSYGRAHRIGQTRKVISYRFITQGTIEESIYKSLEKKEDFNYRLWEEKELESRYL